MFYCLVAETHDNAEESDTIDPWPTTKRSESIRDRPREVLSRYTIAARCVQRTGTRDTRRQIEKRLFLVNSTCHRVVSILRGIFLQIVTIVQLIILQHCFASILVGASFDHTRESEV